MSESTNQPTTPSTPNVTSTCCEYFIKTLNKETSLLTISLSCDENEVVKDEVSQKSKELIINNNFDKSDLSSFLNFCNLWQQKQCVCIFTNEDLLEKFHHFVHNIIASCIIVIGNLKADADLVEEETTAQTTVRDENERETRCNVRYWSFEWKEKLFTALSKILNLNMPLYVTSKHMMLNVNNLLRFKRITNECNCSRITTDPIGILQMYCQANVNNQDVESLPVDLLMNISLFVDLHGLYAIKSCFMNATPESLNINLAHLLFNVLVNLRIWLNFSIVEKQIFTMRTSIINYMCQLSDTDLRIAGAKNTTDLMYDSFKGFNVSSSSANTSTLASVLTSDNQEGSSSSSSLSSTSSPRRNSFKVDNDGLKLALKYFLCSTLTIRLCGVAQMNLQISAWNDFNSTACMNLSKKRRHETSKIELADWFLENKIIEHLFGPNLHVEVIKRSQDIMNFLAFSNRLTDKHLDVIWTSAQLKHCAKPVMDMLMSLHKHLNVESVHYLSKLVASLELNQHNEQTILLSALLTKNLWSIMLDMGETNQNKSKPILVNKSQSKMKQERQSKSSLKTLKRSLLSHQKKLSKQIMKNKRLKSNSPMKRIIECEGMEEEEEEENDDEDEIKEDNSSDEYDDVRNRQVNNSKAKQIRNQNARNEQEIMDDNSNSSQTSINYSKKKEILPQKIVKRHNQSMETQLSSEGESYEKNRAIKKLIEINGDDDDEEDYDDDDDDEERDENKEGYEDEEEDEEEEEDEDGEDDDEDDDEEEEEEEDEDEDDDEDEDNEEESDETDESDDIENDENNNGVDELDEDSGDNEVDRVLNSNYRPKAIPHKQAKTSLRSELMKIDRAQMRMQAENEKLRAQSEDKEIAEINKSIFAPSNRNSNQSTYGKEQAKRLVNLINSDETRTDGSNSNLNKFMLLNQDENNSQSSFVSNPSSAKNMNEFDDCDDDDDELNIEEQENSLDHMNMTTKTIDSNNANKRDIELGLENICSNGHTFLWDLLMNNESWANSTHEQLDSKHQLNDQNGESCSKAKPMTGNANEKILKEAEKQLQTLLCLPSTDKRIRYKFIESCILNLKSNRACVTSLRLLIKLFSSFQQFSNSSYNLDKLNMSMSVNTAFNHAQNSVHLSPLQTHLVINTSPSSHHSAIGYNAPSNIIEVHRIVAYTENNCSMISLFFENLKAYTNEQFAVLSQIKADEEKLELISRIRVNLLTRLQFLSFVYSTLGSPKDFELVQEYVELLWDSLIRFDDYNSSTSSSSSNINGSNSRKVCISVKDDLFNWFLNQAKNKDQHAMNIDTFKLILCNKMPLLDLHNFSQNALHLYQELFKIYKYSCIQHDFANYKQMEASVIDYIFKLAFVSRNTDVSLAAIQFLNSHFLQIDTISDVDQQSKFVEYCMNYLSEARDNLCMLILHINSSNKHLSESIVEKLKMTSNLVARVFLLLKNHLNSFLQRHSYQLRLFELSDLHWLSHNKQLQCLSGEKVDSKQFQNQYITLVCHVNPTQFKFNLIVSTSDCVGDLKALIKEILFRIIKSDVDHSRQTSATEHVESKLNNSITFNSLLLSNKAIDYAQMYKHSFACLMGTNPNLDSMALIKSIIENDDDFYLKIYANGQELTSSNANATSTLLMDSKLLSDLAIKDMQTVHVNLYSHRANESKKCAPIKLDKNSIPTLFLSNEPHFTNLFRLINLLCKLNSKLKETASNYHEVVSNNEIAIDDLCRKVWEVIMILPTNKNYLSSIQNKTEWYFNELIDHLLIVKSNESDKANANIFENNSPYQMLYYLQIIEIIFKRQMTQSDVSTTTTTTTTTFTLNETVWCKYLFKLLSILTVHLKDKLNKPIDEILFDNDDNKQTCLNTVDSLVMLESISIVLRLLSHCLLIVNNACDDDVQELEEIEDVNETPRKMARKMSLCRFDTVLSKQVNIELLKELLVDDVQYEERFLLLIFNIQTLASLASSPTQFQTVNFVYDIKLELLNNSMLLLTSCLFFKHSKEEDAPHTFELIAKIKEAFVRAKLYEHRINWLKCTLLYENKLNNQFRKEVCSWFHRICVFENTYSVKPALNDCILNELLGLINTAVQYKPCVQMNLCSKEYFHLLTNLIGSVDANELLLNDLAKFIQSELKFRECYETANTLHSSACGLNYLEDDVLVGLLSIAIAIIKKQVSQKRTDASLFIDELFDYLFKLNKSDQIELPKCRSTQARCLCFDLLVELCRYSQENFVHLFDKLIVLNKSPTQLNNYTGHEQFVWDYWPRDDVRSPCGYVGLVNLGATCYMATSMQHLYMIKEARDCVLKSHFEPAAAANKAVHDQVLFELKRLFAYLSESERKAYNPKDFCKVYTMDQQQLNTTEQKDMQEFFTDLISKLEETSNEQLKPLLKRLFGGVITNLVISLDCSHVSCTLEEFYTVRCQVAGMKDLYDSLNEITIKDTLEGDNMYTCSKCARKVRAEKRACFRQLPKILCFNTMRYTFNMITMMKEKINTHFSFPLKLDMSGYMEKNLIPANVMSSQDVLDRQVKGSSSSDGDANGHQDQDECYIYELIGVTVHTGTADGGHYYSFIRDRNAIVDCEDNEPKWYFFNDAEVKPFDAGMQLAAECFGGEATSKTYDSTSDKFMDMSFEKTNSAYMLFYEKQSSLGKHKRNVDQTTTTTSNENMQEKRSDQELFNTIRDDNFKFLHDRLLFENGYFNFVWQMCDVVPRTLLNEETILLATRLAVTFILETYIHSRDKPNMMQWSEMLTKYFSINQNACKWFIKHMIQQSSEKDTSALSWCAKVFLKCPNSTIRQFFQRLLIHIVKSLLSTDAELVEMFIVKFIELMQSNHKADENNVSKYNIRFMSEYFVFLIEFARLGMAENMMLVKHDTIGKVARFYLRNRRPQATSSKNKTETSVNSPGLSSSSSSSSLNSMTSSSSSCASTSSSSSSSSSASSDSSTSAYDEIIPLHDQKSKLKVFEKLIMLISILSEQNSMYFQSQLERANEDVVCMEELDSNAELFRKMLRKHNKLKLNFFYKSILDEINLSHIRIILFALIRLNNCALAISSSKQEKNFSLAVKFINMCCRSIRKLQTKRASQPSENDRCIPFFSIMGNCTIVETDQEVESVNTETISANANSAEIRTDFSQLIIDKLEYLFECAPYHTLQWLTSICANNRRIQSWLVDNMHIWVKQLLVDNKQTNIRFSATILLANLVPNRAFRETFTSNRNMLLPYKPQQQSLSSSSSSISLSNANELSSSNCELDSVECKQVLHKIIKHLFSFMSELSEYVVVECKSTNVNDSLNETTSKSALCNRLIQYFTFLIYCMIGKDEKRLFVTYEQTIDKFWSIYYPHISNNHVFTNLNKQVSIHFFYQTLCPENIDYILEVDTEASNNQCEESASIKRVKFKSRIARELPICTVAVDHEDADLVSYNRQCLHPYYATIRLLCQQNRAYLKEMFTHSNFQWAFKHIMPFSIQYPLASQELNKFVQLFIQMKDTDDETKKLIHNFKENLATIFMMNSEVDPKQCWQSILITMRSLIETLDDATLVLTRRGLNVLSACFFHISMLYQNNYAYQDTNSSSHELIESIQLLMQVCECVKHHLDKKTEGINQIVQAWKERNELCKRLLMLVNFYNIVELRNRALDLLRMVISVSPNDTLLFVLNQIYVAFFVNTPQAIANYLTNNCNQVATGSNGKQNCTLHLQLLSQAIHIMGPYFPTNKKLNMSQVSNHLNKQPRLVFNMFLPMMFVAHSHLNGSVLINQSNDYEKALADNYAPFLTFFDWLCRTYFSRHVAELSEHVQSTKQLVDLVLFISQQSILLSITFISYLVNQLVATLENQQQQEPALDLPGSSSSVSNMTIMLNQSSLGKNLLFKLISESSHLTAFLMVLINDFRYLLNRKELYEFVQLFAFKLVANTRKSDQEKPSKLKEKQDESVESKMSLIKTIMERSCHSINEIRFYFEFMQLSKHLLAVIETADNESGDVPNITNNIDFKSSQMLGSLKLVHLILATTSNESDTFNNEVDNYNFYKFKVQIRNFLIETTEYMRIQLSETAKFVLNHTPRRSADVMEAPSSESNSVQNEKTKSDDNSEQMCKKVKLNADGKEEEVGQEATQESVLSSILRQVEIKRKYLEHILQNLVQTLNYLNSLIASSSSEFAESENSSSSSRHSSSQHSSRSNSPVNLDEPNEQQQEQKAKLDETENDQNKNDPIMSIN